MLYPESSFDATLIGVFLIRLALELPKKLIKYNLLILHL